MTQIRTDSEITSRPSGPVSALGPAGAAVAVAGVAVNALAYLVPLLGARQLTADGLSALATALAIGAIATVPGLGLQTALAVRCARQGHVPNAGRVTAVTAMIAAGALILTTPLTVIFLRLPATIALLLAATTAAVVFASRWLGELQGRQRFGRLAVGMALLAVARYGGVLGGLVFGADVVGSLALGAAVAVLCLPAFVFLAGKPSPAASSSLPETSALPETSSIPETSAGSEGRLIRGREVMSASTATLAMLAVSYADLILARYLLPAAESGGYAVGAVLAKGALWAPQVVTVLALPLLARGSRRALVVSFGLVTACGGGLVLASWLAGGLAMGLAGGPDYADLGGYAVGFAAVGALYAIVYMLVNADIARGARWPGAVLWLGLLGFFAGAQLLNPPTLGGLLSVSVAVAALTALAMIVMLTLGGRSSSQSAVRPH